MKEETYKIYLNQVCSRDSEAEQKQSKAILNSASKMQSQQNSFSQHDNILSENFQSPKKNSHLNKKQLLRTPSTQEKHKLIDVQVKQQKTRNQKSNQKFQRLNNVFCLIDAQNDSLNKIRQNLAKIAFELEESEENVLRQYKLFKRNINAQVPKSQKDQLEPQQRKINLKKTITEFLKKNGYFSLRQFVFYSKQTEKKQYTKKQIQQCFQKLVQDGIVCYKKEQKSDDYIYDIFNSYKQNGNSLLFFSNYTYVTKGILVISVGLLCGEKGISFVLIPRRGQEKRHTLELLLETYFRQYGPVEKYVVITAFQDVFNSNSVIDDDINQKELYAVLQPRGSSLFILHQTKEYMNIALRILYKYITNQRKTDVQFMDFIIPKLDFAKRSFKQQAFLNFITKKPSRTSTTTYTSKVQEKIQHMSE